LVLVLAMFLSRDVFENVSSSPVAFTRAPSSSSAGSSPSHSPLLRPQSGNGAELSLPTFEDDFHRSSRFDPPSLAQHVGSPLTHSAESAYSTVSSSSPFVPSSPTVPFDSSLSRPGTASSRTAAGGLGPLSTSAAERRQKLLEQQRAQMFAKKAKAVNAGMVRTDSSSPSRPALSRPGSASPPIVNTDVRPTTASAVYTFRPTTASSSAGGSGSLSNSSSNSSQFGCAMPVPVSPLTIGKHEEHAGGTLREFPSSVGRDHRSSSQDSTDPGHQLSALERDLLSQGIQPVFEPESASKPEVKLDLSDLRSFLTLPVPKGSLVQCYIVRHKKGIANRMYPTYELYTKDDQFLLISKKRSKNKTSNYLISMDKKNLDKSSPSYLGKLRSNFIGTEFTIYDKGLSPKDVEKESLAVSMMTVRQELGAVIYASNLLGSRGPRKMTVIAPQINKDGTKTVFRPLDEEQSILSKYKNNELDGVMVMHNKQPKWNDQFEAYVLNFNGRVTMASVKNFQIITEDDPENILLQFGRIAADKFTMDLRWPLSPLQAFAICLSSFDSKLACE